MSQAAIDAIFHSIISYSRNGPDDSFCTKFKDGANETKGKVARIFNVKSPEDIAFAESSTQAAAESLKVDWRGFEPLTSRDLGSVANLRGGRYYR